MSQFFPGLPTWEEGLHDDEPTEYNTVDAVSRNQAYPEKAGDAQGEIRDENNSRPYSAKGGRDHALSVPAPLFYRIRISLLIYKASWVYGVIFE
jgi:hypothetical protein